MRAGTWKRVLRNLALVGLLAAAAACQFDQSGVAFDDTPDAGAEVGNPDMAPPPTTPDAGDEEVDPCANGACECPLPLEDCGGACVDLLDDEDHCGACGEKCGRDERCEQGACYRARKRPSCDDCGDDDVCEQDPNGDVYCIEVGGDG